MAVLKYKNPDTGEWEVIPHIIQGEKGDKGDKGDSYTLTDADKQEISALTKAVSYESQTLTNAQKEIARNNIGAVSQTELDETIGNINSILATVVNGGVS